MPPIAPGPGQVVGTIRLSHCVCRIGTSILINSRLDYFHHASDGVVIPSPAQSAIALRITLAIRTIGLRDRIRRMANSSDQRDGDDCFRHAAGKQDMDGGYTIGPYGGVTGFPSGGVVVARTVAAGAAGPCFMPGAIRLGHPIRRSGPQIRRIVGIGVGCGPDGFGHSTTQLGNLVDGNDTDRDQDQIAGLDALGIVIAQGKFSTTVVDEHAAAAVGKLEFEIDGGAIHEINRLALATVMEGDGGTISNHLQALAIDSRAKRQGVGRQTRIMENILSMPKIETGVPEDGCSIPEIEKQGCLIDQLAQRCLAAVSEIELQTFPRSAVIEIKIIEMGNDYRDALILSPGHVQGPVKRLDIAGYPIGGGQCLPPGQFEIRALYPGAKNHLGREIMEAGKVSMHASDDIHSGIGGGYFKRTASAQNDLIVPVADDHGPAADQSIVARSGHQGSPAPHQVVPRPAVSEAGVVDVVIARPRIHQRIGIGKHRVVAGAELQIHDSVGSALSLVVAVDHVRQLRRRTLPAEGLDHADDVAAGLPRSVGVVAHPNVAPDHNAALSDGCERGERPAGHGMRGVAVVLGPRHLQADLAQRGLRPRLISGDVDGG